MEIDQYKKLNIRKLSFDSSNNVLLLQGPKGNFFSEFAKYINSFGARVYKINFSLAEDYFYSEKDSTFYHGRIEKWPSFFKNFVIRNKINRVYLLNDCRPYHQNIIQISKDYNLEIFVFEDGYFRPGHITLEPYGVNGNSHINKFALNEFDNVMDIKELNFKLQNKFISRVKFSLISNLNFIFCSNYSSYRPLNSYYWAKRLIKSYLIFFISFCKDSITFKMLKKSNKKKFFVPLQVFDDTQIRFHSSYESNFDFIDEIFNQIENINRENFIIMFKQHPGDRGQINYKKYIQKKIKKNNLSANISFSVVTPVKKFIEICDGVILINSTSGIESLREGKEVLVKGNAIYGSMCHRNEIKDFIEEIISNRISRTTYRSVILNNLKKLTQVKASFYK